MKTGMKVADIAMAKRLLEEGEDMPTEEPPNGPLTEQEPLSEWPHPVFKRAAELAEWDRRDKRHFVEWTFDEHAFLQALQEWETELAGSQQKGA